MATPSKSPESRSRRVIEFIRDLIDQGSLRPGSRLPAERELARRIGVSRPTVRAGLRALAAMGVVKTRHGSGTIISETPILQSEPLSLLSAVHGFSREDLFQARQYLEIGAAELAAEKATPEQLAALSEEVANMFASMDNPRAFLVHDILFHRNVASSSGNRILASLVEMVSSLFYEQRRQTAEAATDRNLRDAAEAHRQIYLAIRSRQAERARKAMREHLKAASAHLASEESKSRPRG